LIDWLIDWLVWLADWFVCWIFFLYEHDAFIHPSLQLNGWILAWSQEVSSWDQKINRSVLSHIQKLTVAHFERPLWSRQGSSIWSRLFYSLRYPVRQWEQEAQPLLHRRFTIPSATPQASKTFSSIHITEVSQW
jgi:hypothetical protein